MLGAAQDVNFCNCVMDNQCRGIMNSNVQFFFNQLGFALPMMLVFITAIVLAFINFRRAYVPALVTLIASAALIFLTVARVAVSIFSYTMRSSYNAQFMSYFYLFINAMEAVAIGALVVAIFLGRGTRD